jgi:hypothetical protein
MVEGDLVLLSKTDAKEDSSGTAVTLFEGLHVHVYSDDVDDDGRVDNLIADGVVERNTAGGWTAAARWSCRIDANGIRHESDEPGGTSRDS